MISLYSRNRNNCGLEGKRSRTCYLGGLGFVGVGFVVFEFDKELGLLLLILFYSLHILHEPHRLCIGGGGGIKVRKRRRERDRERQRERERENGRDIPA